MPSKMKSKEHNREEFIRSSSNVRNKKERPQKIKDVKDELNFDWSRDFSSNVFGKECVRRKVKGSNKKPEISIDDNFTSL